MNSAKQHNKHSNSNSKMIHLRVFIDAHGKECKISMEDDSTLEQYFTKKIDLPNIDLLTKEIHSILEHSSLTPEGNNRGFYKGLQDAGQQLYHTLLPLQIKEKISSAEIKNLSIGIDDSLIGIPWEIMHDGEEFLCIRFNIGRRIFTSNSKREKRAQTLNSQINQIKMVILANPTGDLPSSYEEGIKLSEALKQISESLDVYFSTRDITIAGVSRQLLDCDILHYAGHAVYNSHTPDLSGWCLKDGIFTARKIIELCGGKRNFPFLIFSNACQSGQTTKWSLPQPDESKSYDAFDLVNAFLRGGVRHYICPLRNISDPSSLDLALQFYNFILDSYTIGESLRLARARMIEKHGSENLIWAHYVLYGNPIISYLKESAEGKVATTSKIPVSASNSEGSTQEHRITTPITPVIPITRDSVTHGIHDNKGEDGHRRTGRLQEMKRSPQSHSSITEGDEAEKGTFPIGRQDQDQERDQKQKQEREKGREGKTKWQLRNTLFIGCLMLLFLIILFVGTAIFVDRFMKPRDLQPELADPVFSRRQNPKDTTGSEDSAWEEKKWEIIERIQDRMRQRFSESEKAKSNDSYPPSIASGFNKSDVNGYREDSLPLKSTLCIIPERPQGKGNNEERRITDQLIKELYRFWIKQPEYIVVERDRLDFVMRELELATSPLSEHKLRFSVGKIFGTQGIVFIRVFIQPSGSLFLFSSAKHETRIYLHYVDTETTAVKAIAEVTLAKDQDLRSVSKRLGDELIRSLKNK